MTLQILTEAIKEYRREGIELMERLGKKFGYDISIKEQYEELIRKGNSKVPRKGQLSQRVNYAFHGGECHFHKKKTQQNIEVILTNPPKFGKIDSWFLKSFLDSTKEYSELTKNIDWKELKLMVNESYKTGKIEEIK
ncbi:DUF6896 domain-containing protein [Tenacibaculum mesophilum]|uniref:DUF6896 domain-containing protein n=1 Tax=Tenacibaculum mesophilum TaxID=104268 RepID=UPI0024916E25|nr:hypothetical protein [Tenacibaculum mesophilum]